MSLPDGPGIAIPRVLFISRKWPPAVGGMEEFSHRVADAMKSLSTVRLVVLPGRQDGRSPSGIRLIAFFLEASLALIRYGRRSDVIVIGDLVLGGLVGLARLVAPQGRPVVVVHGLDLLYARRKGPFPAMYALYLRCIRRSIRAVVANSRATAESAREMGFGNVRTVRLGVALPTERPMPAAERHRRMVLYVGRLVPRKGAGWFAEQVLPLLDGAELVVVGPPTDEEEVRRVSDAQRVRYLGTVEESELKRLRDECWVAVVPNVDGGGADMEGFGLTAVEAAAAGSVVIGADIDGVSDAIINGETGFLLPPGDPTAWRDLIVDVQGWDDARYDSFVHESRRLLADHYSWDRVAREILQAASEAGPQRGPQ